LYDRTEAKPLSDVLNLGKDESALPLEVILRIYHIPTKQFYLKK
jgi:hypothetical protein